MVTKKKTTPPKEAAAVIEPATPEANAPESTQSAPVKMVRRKELIERIVATSGLKPNAVKSVLDAVFSEMGKALSDGEGLNIHPLGKITVNRKKEFEDHEVLVCKIRRKTGDQQTSLDTAAE